MKTIILYIYSFIFEGLLFVLIFTPFYIILRYIFIKVFLKKDIQYRTDIVREEIMFLYFVFLVLLFVQTFVVNSGENEINLIPFYVIVTQISEVSNGFEEFKVLILNIPGNILIFTPIGFFTSYLFKTDLKHTAIIGFLISLTIEGGQLPLPRTSDIDDLILNTTGAIIGYGIYKIIIQTVQKQK